MPPSLHPITVQNHFRSRGGSTYHITTDSRLWWLVPPVQDDPICLDPFLRESRWKVHALGRRLSIGARTLSRIVERSTGMPFKRWLREHRAVTACHLLREGWKIEALARELGFRHAASFAREFQSIVGLSPSAYLEKEKSRFFIPPP